MAQVAANIAGGGAADSGITQGNTIGLQEAVKQMTADRGSITGAMEIFYNKITDLISNEFIDAQTKSSLETVLNQIKKLKEEFSADFDTFISNLTTTINDFDSVKTKYGTQLNDILNSLNGDINNFSSGTAWKSDYDFGDVVTEQSTNQGL